MTQTEQDPTEFRLSVYLSGLCFLGVLFLAFMVDYQQFNSLLYLPVMSAAVWAVGAFGGGLLIWCYLNQSNTDFGADPKIPSARNRSSELLNGARLSKWLLLQFAAFVAGALLILLWGGIQFLG